MHRPKRILLTGGNGFLGIHVCDALRTHFGNDIEIQIPSRPLDDLRVMETCERLVQGVDTVIHLAARVGGIGFNQKYPGTLFYDNAIMGIQLMEAARVAKVAKFVAIGTVCAYPKFTPVPFKEDELWNGYPEETNAPYGLAKKMMLVQAQAYRAQYGMNAIFLLPVNLYGPGDEFGEESSHVIPALIRRFVEARDSNKPSVEIWGTGSASREFCFVRDAAEAIVCATELYNGAEPVNIGSGVEQSIKNLVEQIKLACGYTGELVWDASKPDGQPRRCLDISRAKEQFGFVAQTPFSAGLQETIAWFEQHKHKVI